MALTLEYFFLDGAGGDEAVYKAVLFLSVTPNTGECLLVGSGVPVGVEEDEAVGADEVDAASTGLGGEEEDEFRVFRVVELVDKFLAFCDVHCTIKAKAGVVSLSAKFDEYVEGLGEVGNEYDFVVGFGADAGEHAVQDRDFTGEAAVDFAIAGVAVVGFDVAFGKEVLGAGHVFGEFDKVGVVAELFEGADRFERLGAFAPEKGSDFGGGEEMFV